MDIFNKRKVAELEKVIEKQDMELERLRQERKSKNNGEHEVGAWCHGCRNLIIHNVLGYHPAQFCKLDNKCKDRRE